MSCSSRRGSVLVCDDLQFGINGKWTASGIYVNDIGIAVKEQQIPQLVFIFTAETKIDNPWQSLAFEVLLPGDSAPLRTEVPFAFDHQQAHVQRTSLMIRAPLLFQQPTLRPGQIKASIVDENGETLLAAPWIVTQHQKVPI